MKAVRTKASIGSFVSFRGLIGKYSLGMSVISKYHLGLLFHYSLSQWLDLHCQINLEDCVKAIGKNTLLSGIYLEALKF